MSDLIHEAVLTLLTSLSPRNLASGETAMVLVYRPSLNELRDALEAEYPGALDQAQQRMYGPRVGDQS